MFLQKDFFQNHAFYKKVFLQNRAFQKIFLFKIMVFETARKTQNFRILRGKLNQNVINRVQSFFKIVLFKILFFQNQAF